MTTALLTSLIVSSALQNETPVGDLPRIVVQTGRTSNVGVPLERPDLYDGLMIATVLGPAVARRLPGEDFLAAQRVRVEDSRAFQRGALVDIYYPAYLGNRNPFPPGKVIDQTGAPQVGTRVFLVARAAKAGKLRIPDLNRWETPDRKTVQVDSRSSAAFGEAFFLTSRTVLAPNSDPKWRFIESLAQAIPGTGDENAVKITDFMRSFAGPNPNNNYGQPDDQLSLTFAAAVSRDTAYHRALVDLALNRLRYWGYGDRLFRDLQAAATDVGAFPEGIPPVEFEESPGTGNNPKLPKDFRHDPPLSQPAILGILAKAKSSTLAAGYLSGLTTKPADSDVRAMARFLDSPDPRLRRAYVERLAAWNREPAPAEAREVIGLDGSRRLEFPGLDEAVARWRKRLKAKAK